MSIVANARRETGAPLRLAIVVVECLRNDNMVQNGGGFVRENENKRAVVLIVPTRVRHHKH
jgi:hypothetical protein